MFADRTPDRKWQGWYLRNHARDVSIKRSLKRGHCRVEKRRKKSSVTQNTVVAHAEVHRNSTCTLFHSFSRPHRFSSWVDHWSRGFFYSTLPNTLHDSKSESLLSATRVSHELVSRYHVWFFYKFRYPSNEKLKKKEEMNEKEMFLLSTLVLWSLWVNFSETNIYTKYITFFFSIFAFKRMEFENLSGKWT